MWRMIALTLLGVVVAAAFHWFGLQIGPFGFEGERKHIARLQREVVEMHMAGELATSQMNAQNLAIEASYSTLARKSHAEHQTALEGARSAVARYAAANPASRVCRQGADHRSAAVDAAMPANPQAPADPDALAGMVALRPDDLDQLVAASVQADSSRSFLQSLIDEGFAVIAEPDLTPVEFSR